MMPQSKKARHARLRKTLQETRRVLWDELRQEISQLGDDYRYEFDQAMDSGDRSVLDVMQSVGIKLVDIRQSQLAALAQAERKLNEGTYGVCELCGEEIAEERLLALPFAVHCLDCAERLEKERVQGRGPTL
jgi:DnaK suppressor protein